MKEHKSPVLSSEVFTTLKDRIIHWDYSPAHRFKEEELSEEFGVSRSPVREALQMLVENGLVTKESHRGYVVKQPDAREIHELYGVRQALEVYIVEWLATNGMPADTWDELYAQWQGISREISPAAADFARHDEEFHEKLAECTGNQVIIQYLNHVNERLHFIRMTDITSLARLCTTCEQHLEILDSIRNREVERARQAMKMNIEGGRDKVELALKEALSRAFSKEGILPSNPGTN